MKKSREESIFEIFEKKLPSHYGTNDVRLTQIQMSMDIAAFLQERNRKKILFLEAPVGTGKSLGSLIPALVEVKQGGLLNRKRIVYATATINLQGQLMNEEIPLLGKLRLLKTAILAKGKSHYYCHKEYRGIKDRIDPDYQKAFEHFYGASDTGHRNEFEDQYLEIDNGLWDRVSLRVTKRECEQCPYSLTCPSYLHRNQFLSDGNDLVITNHDQLIRSVLNRSSEPIQAPLVPIDPGIIIIDEAHHFQENFLGQLQNKISVKELRSLSNNHQIPKTIKASIKHVLVNLEDQLKKESESVDSQQGRYPVPSYFHSSAEKLIGLFNDVINHIVSRNIGRSFMDNRNDEFTEKLEQTTEILRNIVDHDDYVSWIVYDDFSVSCIANDFPNHFRTLIRWLSQRNKIIVMSGTLTENGDFDSLLKQWRLNNSPDVDTKSIPSSFNYNKQALIYVPEDLPDPTKQVDLFIPNQVGHIKRLIDLTQGRSLILSTSKSHMEDIALAIKPFCMDMNINFLQQDQSGVEQLTKQFKKDETSVLIGTGSFFSGFSVPGSSLVSVIFTRLPFPVPDDPFLKLLGEGYEDVFFDSIAFPHMMVKLNQGLGRLIRDIKDYGIVTILDPRVFGKPYSKRIQEEFRLKGYRITQSYEEVVRFYKEKVAKGSGAQYEAYDRNKVVVHDSLKEFGRSTIKQTVVETPKKKPKKDKITDEQMVFAQMICKKNGVPYPNKIKNTQDLYAHLYNIYYSKYRKSTEVTEQFPYKDETQRQELSKFRGDATRTYTAPRCTSQPFGCDGQCSQEHKDRISDMVMQRGGIVSEFYNVGGWCLLMIDPKELVEELLD